VKFLLQQFAFREFGHVFGYFDAAFIQLQQLNPLAGFVSLFSLYDEPFKLMKDKKTVFCSIESTLICRHIALLVDISYIRAIKTVKDNKL